MVSEWDDPAAREAVFNAMKRGDVTAVQAAVDRGFPPTAVDERGYTLLHWATFNGIDSVVPYLVATHWDVNARTPAGDCPLFFACWWCQLDTVKQLVKAGASLQYVNRDGWTVAHYVGGGCWRPGRMQVLEWLASRPEVDWFSVSRLGSTALKMLSDIYLHLGTWHQQGLISRCVAMVKGAMAAQREREARWSPLRAAFVSAVATAI
jgi:hypothetical protein